MRSYSIDYSCVESYEAGAAVVALLAWPSDAKRRASFDALPTCLRWQRALDRAESDLEFLGRDVPSPLAGSAPRDLVARYPRESTPRAGAVDAARVAVDSLAREAPGHAPSRAAKFDVHASLHLKEQVVRLRHIGCKLAQDGRSNEW